MKYQAALDYLTFTFPVPLDLNPYQVLRRAAATVSGFGMFIGLGDIEEKGKFGYSFSLPLHDNQTGEAAGFIAAGGSNAGSCMVSITGQGCPLIDPRRVADFLERVGGRLTRVDLAVDDYDGKRTPHDVRAAYLAGEFKMRGQNPTPGQAGPWDNPEQWGSGLTYYVGKRGSGKMLRAYDKGKEQGDPNSNWTRFEVELRRNYRDLDLEILRDPHAAFLSAYPWLEWAATEENARPIGFLRREKGRANVRHLMFHARRSYGKLLHMLHSVLKCNKEATFDALCRLGLPSRVDERYYWREGEMIDGVGVCNYV